MEGGRGAARVEQAEADLVRIRGLHDREVAVARLTARGGSWRRGAGARERTFLHSARYAFDGLAQVGLRDISWLKCSEWRPCAKAIVIVVGRRNSRNGTAQLEFMPLPVCCLPKGGPV